MVRKKRVQHLDGRQRSLVENALYYANPPETPQIVHITLPPMLQYIQKLLYKDLNKVNTEKVSCNQCSSKNYTALKSKNTALLLQSSSYMYT